jgi:hypothetical protein
MSLKTGTGKLSDTIPKNQFQQFSSSNKNAGHTAETQKGLYFLFTVHYGNENTYQTTTALLK